MQFEQHEYLTPISRKAELYKFVFPLIAIHNGEAYHVGSACIIGPGFLVTAKHVLRYMFERVAGLEIKGYGDPDVMESAGGPLYDLLLEHDVRLDALQFLDDGQVQRYAVTNYVRILHKYTDLLVLRVSPHPAYPLVAEPQWHIPTLDLVPPRAGLAIVGYGCPDHPDHGLITPDPWLHDYLLYQGAGVVEEVNLQDNLRDFRTSMKTHSGMSGGPVFVRRENQDHFCGIISKGSGFSDYSYAAPLWQIAWAATDAIPGFPEREGKTLFADLMMENIIPTIGSEHLSVHKKEGEGFRVKFDNQSLLEHGH